MDDDLTFGASVWAASEPTDSATILKSEPLLVSDFDDTTFDDFDEFGEPEDTTGKDLRDDDFGDFGDFENVGAGSSTTFGDVGFEADVPVAGPSSRLWRPLYLDSSLSRSGLESQIGETLGPIWNNEDLVAFTTDESIREAEGISQILCTSSRYVHGIHCSLSELSFI